MKRKEHSRCGGNGKKGMICHGNKMEKTENDDVCDFFSVIFSIALHVVKAVSLDGKEECNLFFFDPNPSRQPHKGELGHSQFRARPLAAVILCF
jgi:hypothetical protein